MSLGWRVKNFFGHMDRIGNDDDLGDIITIWSLVYTAPNGEQFCFSTGDVNHMIKGLGDRVVVGVHVWYRCSNVVFDISIYDYNGGRMRI